MDVSFNTAKAKWRTRVSVEGQRIHIGWFLTKARAEIEYKKHALILGINHDKRRNGSNKVL